MKQSKRYIAITGGIGSGKSTVAHIIEELGYPVFSADAVARGIYDDPFVRKELCTRFPSCMNAGNLDRAALAEIVFTDATALQTLDAITHPVIMRHLWDLMEAVQSDSMLVFAEVPLLLEGGYENTFDGVIVVRRPLEQRIQAVSRRDGLTREQVLARIKNQFDYKKNSLLGHTVIDNDGNMAALHTAVRQVVYALEAQSEK